MSDSTPLSPGCPSLGSAASAEASRRLCEFDNTEALARGHRPFAFADGGGQAGQSLATLWCSRFAPFPSIAIWTARALARSDRRRVLHLTDSKRECRPDEEESRGEDDGESHNTWQYIFYDN